MCSVSNVLVRLTSTLNTYEVQKKFARSLTIAEFKCKLELVVGSPAACMELELFGADDQLLLKLDKDEALLGSYPIDDGCRIHVIDRSGAKMGEYEDCSKVEKYDISDDQYDKRADSVRSFLKRNKLGKFEENQAKKETEQEQKEASEKALAEAITVGARCEVAVPGQPKKWGIVMFVGRTEFKPGYWIGVKYDEPLGKNDGSVNGKRYFECLPKYGAFVKPHQVTVGDFPEEDYGLDDEM